MRVAALVAAFMVFQPAPSPQDGTATLLENAHGPAGFVQQLVILADRCRGSSPAFEQALLDFWRSGANLELGWNSTSHFPGAFGGAAKPQTVDLADLWAFPEAPDPPRIPSWASTRCSVLVHEIAEATYAKRHMAELTGSLFDSSHRYAIATENLVRRDRGSLQCRSKDWPTNEVTDVPHGSHSDQIARYGGHTERVHGLSTRSITISYEEGRDMACQPSNYDR